MGDGKADPAVSALRKELRRTRQRLFALEAESRLRWAGRSVRYPVEFTSQYGEDLMLWELFDGASDGFFIEAGAFDGYHYSVTYAFEAVGWNGLLVEAAPEPVERCARRRRYSKVHHNVLSH